MEGDDPIGFLKKMLPTWIPELATSSSPQLDIDRTHRIDSSNTAKPRTMIFDCCDTLIGKPYFKVRERQSHASQMAPAWSFTLTTAPGQLKKEAPSKELEPNLGRKESTISLFTQQS